MEKHHSACSCHEHVHPRAAASEDTKAVLEISYGNGLYSLEGHLHEGATVVSGECALQSGEPDRVRQHLRMHMEQLAGWVKAEKGYIGHIKSGVTLETVEMLSITDTELYSKEAENTGIKIRLAAIVFLIDLACLEEKMEEILRSICSLS